MICYEILHAIRTSIFMYDESVHTLRVTETQDFSEFDGQTFEVLEDRKEVDGSTMPQYGLTEALGALVADEELSLIHI